ncbi:lytic transglycosylase domain-containing protein [Bradyrhizobium sp. B124]|uniref:lytic transglycosylase domain-containing protein n=1 Tax=Bradyrhizobium sp. B124 TaxID=3140245 RepID=UPI003182E0E1
MSSFRDWSVIKPFCSRQYSSFVSAISTTIDRPNRYSRMPQDRAKVAFCLKTKRRLPSLIIVCCLGVLLRGGLPSAGGAEPASRAQARRLSNPTSVTPYTSSIVEASHRCGIPEHWIEEVIEIESGGKPNAVSARGALGLMQIMPQTWVELSVRYGLGLDPFDPHDNILAGTAYLREMLNRFGSAGFLAAYNAGPKRYEEHLAWGRSLPDETQAYVQRLAPLLGIGQLEHGSAVITRMVDWRQATVFVRRSESSFVNGSSTSIEQSLSFPKDTPRAHATAFRPRAADLFVRRSGERQSR